jgi:hypothetical protein
MQLSIQTDTDKLRPGRGLRFIAAVLPFSLLHASRIAKSPDQFGLRQTFCALRESRFHTVADPAPKPAMNFE